MEKGDKGSTLTRMGLSGWLFLLVPAYPGCPGQTAVKWLLLLLLLLYKMVCGMDSLALLTDVFVFVSRRMTFGRCCKQQCRQHRCCRWQQSQPCWCLHCCQCHRSPVPARLRMYYSAQKSFEIQFTALVTDCFGGMVINLVMPVCFQSSFSTAWPLTLIFCLCIGDVSCTCQGLKIKVKD